MPLLAVGLGVSGLPNQLTNGVSAAATAVQPQRVLDTRSGLGGPVGPVAKDGMLALALPTAAAAGATSVVLNLTATEASAPGWVKAWPCGDPMPPTSSLNFVPGRSTANAVVLKLPPSGICLSTSTSVQLIADLTGWFTSTTDFTGSTPNRVLDTRITQDPLIAGQERRVRIAGQPGISATAAIAALNLTVVTPNRAGWVVAYPCGQPTESSTVNFSAGEIVANLTFVALTEGDVCLRSMVDVDLVIDSFGWSTGSAGLRVQSPQRLLDTREPSIWPYGAPNSGSKVLLRVAGRGGIPNDAAAALLTVTVTDSNGNGFVTAWPCDQELPSSSTINTWAGALRSNLAMVELAPDGTACLHLSTSNDSGLHMVIDGVGFTPGGPQRPAPTAVGSYVPGTGAGGGVVNVGGLPNSSAGEPSGNFRFVCAYSHMAYADPIVYPGQRGASHLHTFFGNTSANPSSTYDSLRSSGGGSCQGGVLNRSGYWAPSIIAPNGKAVAPDYVVVYYKGGGGASADAIRVVQPFPAGLKMIAGYNMASPGGDTHYSWNCEFVERKQQTIPACSPGERVGVVLEFPDCWNGRDLDSADHRSHMAYRVYGAGGATCPAGYPVALPQYSVGLWYTHDGNPQNWKLDSDTMAGMTHANGSTFHADWFGAWDPATEQTWVDNCIRGLLQCNFGELGDGTRLSGEMPTSGGVVKYVDLPSR